MLSRRSLVLVGALLVALPTAPVAEGAAKKPRLTSLRGVPAAVQSGKSFRVRGRVTNLPKNRKKSARLVFTLRKSGRFIHLRTVKVKRTKKSRTRRFSVRIVVPGIARAGSYTLRACVRKSCRSKRAAGDRQAGADTPAPARPRPARPRRCPPSTACARR